MRNRKLFGVDAGGNVLISGIQRGAGGFDPDPGRTYNLASAGGASGFVLKLDAGGRFVWASDFASARFGTSTAHGIALDASGNAHVTGSFSGSVDFDPGRGRLSLPNAGATDAYVAKLDTAGRLSWARSMGGPDNDGTTPGSAITVDAAGAVYVTGTFLQTARFGSTTLTGAGGHDVFLAMLDAAGNFGWAVGLGGTGFDTSYGIAVDSLGNIHVIGSSWCELRRR